VPKDFDGKVGHYSIPVTRAMPRLLNYATEHAGQNTPGIGISFYDSLAAR